MNLIKFTYLIELVFLTSNPLVVDSLHFAKNSNQSFLCNEIFNNFLAHSNLFSLDSLVHIIRADNVSKSLELLKVERFFDNQHKTLTDSHIEQVDDILTLFPDSYVLFISNYDNVNLIKNTVSQMLSWKSWNSKAKFLLIATANASIEHDSVIIDSFNFLWSRNVYRVAIAFCEKTSKKATLFSSSPYTKHLRTCRNINHLNQIQKVNLVNNNSSFEISGYSFQVPSNFLGCPLLAKTYPFPPYSVAQNPDLPHHEITYSTGIEVELVRLLANVTNFSLEIKTPIYKLINPWDQVLPNGMHIGMLIDLLNYRTDIGFAGAIPNTPEYFHVSQVFPLFFNSMSWYVPDPDFLPGWHLLARVFSVTVWLFLIVNMVFFVLIYSLMWRVKPTEERMVEPISLSIVRLTLGTPACCYPRLVHFRVMLITWAFFSLNVAIMYNTKLISEFTDRPLDHGIMTLEELHRSNLTTCMSSLYRAYFTSRTDGIIRELIENALSCDSFDDDIKNFLSNRNFSYLSKDDYVSLSINFEKERVHKIKQKFITYPVAILNSKGALHLDALKRVMLIAFESGIKQKWLRDIERNVSFKFNMKNIIIPSELASKAFKKEDFIWQFRLLLLGELVSLLVFIVELWLAKYHKGQSKSSTPETVLLDGYWLID